MRKQSIQDQQPTPNFRHRKRAQNPGANNVTEPLLSRLNILPIQSADDLRLRKGEILSANNKGEASSLMLQELRGIDQILKQRRCMEACM